MASMTSQLVAMSRPAVLLTCILEPLYCERVSKLENDKECNVVGKDDI